MSGSSVLVRSYRREDLGRVVRLWDELGLSPVGPDGLSVDEALDAMHDDRVQALVAEASGDLVGMACASATGPIATVHRLVVREEHAQEATVRLLEAMEPLMAEDGARRLVTWVTADDNRCEALSERGYEPHADLAGMSRRLTTRPGGTLLQGLGGQMIEPGLWDQLQGMEGVKQLIERRVILPLAEGELARRHGVAAPKAIVLFGPPGTGKTTFAKGIASRLRWPFVEVVPTEQVGSDSEVAELARTFDAVMELDTAIVFVDEVEDIASRRQENRRVDTQVTNEFLKQIPRFRAQPRRLLVCATNAIGRLDAAFVRPGRFDYLLPVGPPDADARAAIWRRYVHDITDEDVDLDAIVEASELHTPADIEFAARKAAQLAFEREHFDRTAHRAITQDFLQAIEELRPTLTQEMIETFEHDKDVYSRY